VRRLIALLVGGFGLGAYLRRRRGQGALPAYSPAAELRAKLDETRTPAPGATPETPAPVTEADAEPAPTLESDLDARRREVHDRARGAIDDLS
jgi:hypothetical protein